MSASIGRLYRKGNPYGDFVSSVAADVEFSPAISGMAANNVQDAIIELHQTFNSIKNAITGNTYTFSTSDHKTEFVNILNTQARLNNFTVFFIPGFIGFTMTRTEGNTTFSLYSQTNEDVYVGNFNTLSSSTQFTMYKVTASNTNLFTTGTFPL